MGHLGLEPRTNRLKAGYSTAELMSQKSLNFRGSGEDGGGSWFPIHESNISWLARLVNGVVAGW